MLEVGHATVGETARLPVIILGGSDNKPGPVPGGMKPTEMLTGYKGSIELPSGHCLAEEVSNHLTITGRFERPILLGPKRIYEGKVSCELVNSEGDFLATLRTVWRLVGDRFGASDPVALITCDILPSSNEFQRLLQTGYDSCPECFFWSQLVEAQPHEMGAGSWKPSYRFRANAGEPPKNYYPGHLVIVRAQALRMGLTERLMRLVYRHRNVDVRRRHIQMLAHGWTELLAEDCRNLFAFQPSMLSVSIPYYCLNAFRKFRRQDLTVPEFEDYVAKVFLHGEFQPGSVGRPVVFATTRILSFAKDVDTKAELAELTENLAISPQS